MLYVWIPTHITWFLSSGTVTATDVLFIFPAPFQSHIFVYYILVFLNGFSIFFPLYHFILEVFQPWHSWCFEPDPSLLWRAVLCIAGEWAASLATTHWMPGHFTSQMWQPKTASDIAIFSWEAKLPPIRNHYYGSTLFLLIRGVSLYACNVHLTIFLLMGS